MRRVLGGLFLFKEPLGIAVLTQKWDTVLGRGTWEGVRAGTVSKFGGRVVRESPNFDV